MPAPVFADGRSVRICIAIPAQMAAGVIGANISAQVAGTLPPGRRPARHYQPAVNGLLIHAYRHASAAVRSELRQLIAFRTGTDGHAVPFSNLHKGFAQREPLVSGNSPRFREVAPRLFIQVNKADDSRMRTLFSAFTLNFTNMVVIMPPTGLFNLSTGGCMREFVRLQGRNLLKMGKSALMRTLCGDFFTMNFQMETVLLHSE